MLEEIIKNNKIEVLLEGQKTHMLSVESISVPEPEDTLLERLEEHISEIKAIVK